MGEYTSEQLTNLLATDREKLTRICAPFYDRNIYDYDEDRQCYIDDNLRYYMDEDDFQPLADTDTGRSQVFKLAMKFWLDISMPYDALDTCLVTTLTREEIEHQDPQAAIVIASILTAQQENNDE